jgi:hypothetical protein
VLLLPRDKSQFKKHGHLFWSRNASLLLRENSLFDTTLKCASLFGPENLFLPYLTLRFNFFPNMTLCPFWPLMVLNSTWKDTFAPHALCDKNFFRKNKFGLAPSSSVLLIWFAHIVLRNLGWNTSIMEYWVYISYLVWYTNLYFYT